MEAENLWPIPTHSLSCPNTALCCGSTSLCILPWQNIILRTVCVSVHPCGSAWSLYIKRQWRHLALQHRTKNKAAGLWRCHSSRQIWVVKEVKTLLWSVSPVSQCTKRNNVILHTKTLRQRKPELQHLFWQPLRNKLASLMLIQFTTHIEIYKHIVRQLMSGCTEERSLGCFGLCYCFRQTFLVADEARSCSQVTGAQSRDTPLDMKV